MLTSWLSFPMPPPGYTPQEATEDFGVNQVMLTGLRWSATDNGPVFLMSLDMTATTTIREIHVAGIVRRIREVLRSFAMKVYDKKGTELFHGRLLVDEGRSEGGIITTVLGAHVLAQATSLWFGDVQRRDVPE